jgi:UDP-N-acetylglucosamine transferase subunit ALG13
MPFTRPLREIEAAVAQQDIVEPVIVQSGHTNYPSASLQLVPFFDQGELERMYAQASFVISQAGVGSIMLGLKQGKKVIAIARRGEFDEHIDDHQEEILDVFARTGAVLAWQGRGDLPEVLKQVKDFVPSKYEFGQERISGAILDYLGSAFPRG